MISGLSILFMIFSLAAWIVPILMLWRIASELERIGDVLEDAAPGFRRSTLGDES